MIPVEQLKQIAEGCSGELGFIPDNETLIELRDAINAGHCYGYDARMDFVDIYGD